MQTLTNLFGTDGIRTKVGVSPLTFEHLPLLGKAIAQWALEKYGTNPTILIGHDTRTSASFIKSALQSGMLSQPVTVHDAAILSTPAMCLLTQQSDQFDCGIIISASHNLYHDNGIKIIDHQSGKLSLDDERKISQLFLSLTENPAITYEKFGQSHAFPLAENQYIDKIISLFTPNFLTGIRIIIDCAHGALSSLAPHVFQLLGAHIIPIHNTPNGFNINDGCGALQAHSLQQAVIANRAHCGFAFDGDGDRVIAVNNQGEIKNGDDILALLLMHPLYRSTQTVVGTDMTNYGLEHYLQSLQKQLLRTRVGDKYVAQKLEQENLLIGGEQSGHIILRDYLNSGDGLFTALRVLESLLLTHNWEMRSFTKFPQIHINLPVHEKRDLLAPPIASLIEQSNAQLKSGRLVVRYSGTENLLRIMIEDNELTHAQQIGNQLARDLKQILAT